MHVHCMYVATCSIECVCVCGGGGGVLVIGTCKGLFWVWNSWFRPFSGKNLKTGAVQFDQGFFWVLKKLWWFTATALHYIDSILKSFWAILQFENMVWDLWGLNFSQCMSKGLFGFYFVVWFNRFAAIISNSIDQKTCA